jgi:hypothetical protein
VHQDSDSIFERAGIMVLSLGDHLLRTAPTWIFSSSEFFGDLLPAVNSITYTGQSPLHIPKRERRCSHQAGRRSRVRRPAKERVRKAGP